MFAPYEFPQRSPSESRDMKDERKRFTLDLDPSFQRRLKVIAALKGISMRRYCLAAIEKELATDDADPAIWRAVPGKMQSLGEVTAAEDG